VGKLQPSKIIGLSKGAVDCPSY